MKYFFSVLLSIALVGCSQVPYHDLHLDTTTNITAPSEGKAGIYVYQWKTGIHRAAMDARFLIKGQEVIKVNTGEYAYLELPPGNYEYRVLNGLQDIYQPVEFRVGENYFFRTAFDLAAELSILITDQKAIDEVKQNIVSKRYELNTID